MYCIDSFCPDCLSSLKIVNIVVLHHAINAQQAIRPLNTNNLLLKKWYQTTKLKAWSFGMFPASAQKCPQAFWRSSNSCISAVLGKRVSVLRYLYGRINVLSQWKDKTLPRIQLTGLTCVERDQSPRRCGEAKRLAAVAHVEINAGSACAKCYHC